MPMEAGFFLGGGGQGAGHYETGMHLYTERKTKTNKGVKEKGLGGEEKKWKNQLCKQVMDYSVQ